MFDACLELAGISKNGNIRRSLLLGESIKRARKMEKFCLLLSLRSFV
jgi:hypothetical protein